jgi:pilus assembly protein CpaE
VSIVLNVIVVGSADRTLEDLIRSTGANATSAGEGALASLSSAVSAQPDVIVVDVRERKALPAPIPVIRRQHPLTGIILVAESLDPALLLEAMRAGVTEVVSEPLTPADLEAAITRVVSQRPLAQVGRVFGFVGAKGGVGTTTVAVNVAAALGGIGKPDRTLLIDLHQAGGDAALFVGVEARFSIVDALDNTHRLDQNLLRSLVVEAGPCVDLLAASDRAVAGHLEAAKVRRLLEFAPSVYKHVVIDLPRTDGPIMDALDHVHAIVIVANQELATVKSAGRLANALRQRYGRDRVSVVLSRSDRQADIGHADVERVVGCEVGTTFPSDYRLALQALNKGRPLVLDGGSDLANAFIRYARELAGVRREEPQAARAGLLGRLSLRRV